jgi:hypothetical protein
MTGFFYFVNRHSSTCLPVGKVANRHFLFTLRKSYIKERKIMMNNQSTDASPEYAQRTQLHAVLLVLASMFLLFSSGCATVGQDFPVTRVTDIEIGKTTQQDIRSMFGSPWRVGIEDGQRTWTYGNYTYGLFVEKKAKDLLIRFDDNNVVISYTFSTTEHYE